MIRTHSFSSVQRIVRVSQCVSLTLFFSVCYKEETNDIFIDIDNRLMMQIVNDIAQCFIGADFYDANFDPYIY